MERKLVKQGRNALTTTLPAKWLKERNLKAGDTINIKEHNKNLVISTSLMAEKKCVTIDLREANRLIMFHKVIGKYVEGYDKITLLHNNLKDVKDIPQFFLGIIIEEDTPKRTVLRSIISVPEERFNAVLRRAGHLLVQEAKLLVELTEKKATKEDVKKEHDMLDYNLRYCLRYLNKYESTEHSYKHFLLTSTLEIVGDQIKKIAKYIDGDKKLAKQVSEVIEQYVSCLFKHDFKRMFIIIKKFKKEIKEKTFVDGLAYALGETIYNDIGFLVED